nr:hypothetical protein [Oscillochloris trichoides]
MLLTRRKLCTRQDLRDTPIGLKIEDTDLEALMRAVLNTEIHPFTNHEGLFRMRSIYDFNL